MRITLTALLLIAVPLNAHAQSLCAEQVQAYADHIESTQVLIDENSAWLATLSKNQQKKFENTFGYEEFLPIRRDLVNKWASTTDFANATIKCYRSYHESMEKRILDEVAGDTEWLKSMGVPCSKETTINNDIIEKVQLMKRNMQKPVVRRKNTGEKMVILPLEFYQLLAQLLPAYHNHIRCLRITMLDVADRVEMDFLDDSKGNHRK